MSENHAPPSGPNDRPQPAQPATKHDAAFMRRLYATLLFEHDVISGDPSRFEPTNSPKPSTHEQKD